jgi:hypothetical protein
MVLTRIFSSVPALTVACLTAGCAAGDGEDHGVPAESAYALVTLVWNDEGPTGYVALTAGLDVSGPGLETAREFPGYTSVAAVNGHLLVNPSWEDLTLERYRITDELAWEDAGALSFANEGVEAVSFQTQYMGREHAAYLDIDVTGRVLWDPTDFGIVGRRNDTVLPDSLQLFANFNRTTFTFGDTILRPFSYHDQDWFRWAPDSPLVVYDTATHEPTAVVDAPCPGLDSITRDERGNTYLGSWEYPALHGLMGTGVPPCVVRLTPDNTLDPSFDSDLTSLTEGRFVANFRYVGGGRAIAAVLHAEEYGDDFDFASLAEAPDDFWANTARFHRLWMFDLNARAAAPVTGIAAFEFVNPSFFHAVLEGRTFVFLGDGNNGSNNVNETAVYELDASGHATQKFTVAGSVTQWVRVR